MKKGEFSYDKAMQEMEEIIAKIESGDCKIDDLTVEVKKACDLIAQCRKNLREIEQDIDEQLEKI